MILVNVLKVHYHFQMKFKFLIYTLVLLIQVFLFKNGSAYAKEISLDEGRSTQQETQLVFSRIIVGEFKNSRTGQVMGSDFCAYLTEEFNTKSYWDSQCGSVTQIGESRAINGSDAVMSGEWKDDQLYLTLRSKNLKYVLGSWKVSIPTPDGVLVKPAAEQIASSLISLIPMIGHVMKVAGNGKVLINLGSRKAIHVGQSFKVFEYTSLRQPLNGTQKEIAKLEVQTIVNAETAIAQVYYITRDEQVLSTLAKLKIDDSVLVKSTLTEREGEKSWISLGGQLMNIQVSTDPLSTVQKRNYNFNYTPFMDLAFGTKKMYAHALYGQASGPSADITYLEVEAGTDIYKGNFEEGFVLMGAGLNVSQFSAFNRITPGNYEDSQRISPFLDVRIQYEPRPRFLFYVGSKILYPVFTSGQLNGTQFFSYGAEPYIGTKIQVSSKFAAEVLARSRYLSVNYSGSTGIRETQTAFLLKGIYLIN